jgi:hypothetical protein
LFLNCSTCFGRHTTHHQELKNCNCSLWFYTRFGLPIAAGRQPKTYVKPEAAITVFELLMICGVSHETCWGIKKHWNYKFYYTVASCWFFLWVLYYDARIHEHQVYRNLTTYYTRPDQHFTISLWQTRIFCIYTPIKYICWKKSDSIRILLDCYCFCYHGNYDYCDKAEILSATSSI